MFSHIVIGANDIEVSKKFYDAILAVLGYPEGTIDARGALFLYQPSRHAGADYPD